MGLKFVLVNKGKGTYNNDNPISENDLFEIDSETVETDPTVPAYVKNISETDIQNWVQGFNNNLISGSVTGDKNKTITLTKRDGTTLSIPFIDNEGVPSDDVLNTLDFDKNTGVVTAVTSEGIQITANFDGRYALLGHTHPEYEYTHPPKSWVDKTALTGASVISNITTDSTGHPTGWSVRNLSPSDIRAEPSITKREDFNKKISAGTNVELEKTASEVVVNANKKDIILRSDNTRSSIFFHDSKDHDQLYFEVRYNAASNLFKILSEDNKGVVEALSIDRGKSTVNVGALRIYNSSTGLLLQTPTGATGYNRADGNIRVVATEKNVKFIRDGNTLPNSDKIIHETNINVTTANRPTDVTHDMIVGMMYFDTDLGKPIWWTGMEWYQVASGDGADGNNYANGLTFNTSTGVLSIPIKDLSTLTKNIDGRYALLGHTHPEKEETDPTVPSHVKNITTLEKANWTTGYNKRITGLSITGTSTKTVTLTLADGTTVQGSFTDISTSGGSSDGNDYVSGGNFNTSTGEVTLTRVDGGTVVFDLDNRYEIAFAKNDAFNRNFGGNGTSTSVSRADHSHNYDSYEAWELKVGADQTTITRYEVVEFIAGTNVDLSKSGNAITISATGGGTADGNNYADSLLFENGTLHIGRNGLPELSEKLDGRYSRTNHYHTNLDNYRNWHVNVNYGVTEEVYTGEEVNFVAGANVDIQRSGLNITISATSSGTADGNNYSKAISFNTGTGILTITRNGLTSMSEDLDGRYVTLGTTQTITGSKTFTKDVTATGYYENSLRRLKKNIKPFNKSGLDIVNSIEVVTFDRRQDGAKNKIGAIIEDSPKEIANEDHTAVDLYKTVFVQAKAIQELNKEVKSLKQDIEEIKEIIGK